MTKDQESLIKLENDRYYILASSSYADDRTRVLNSGDTFAVFDRWGDISQLGTGVQGLYHQGTRFLSDMRFRINGYRPTLLSSNIKDENEILSIDLSNPDFVTDEGVLVEKGVLHVSRNKFLVERMCFEKIVVHNYDARDHDIECKFYFAADFKDIFEVRGLKREKRGVLTLPEIMQDGSFKIIYKGLDHITRILNVRFSDRMDWEMHESAVKKFTLKAGASREISYSIQCVIGSDNIIPINYAGAWDKVLSALKVRKEKIAEIETSNEQFTHWINRSRRDMVSLLAETDYGFYPYAGVPWYNTTFGRDAIITAMESLWVAPGIAKGVLLFLAAHQAKESDPFRDAEPGKILHEARGGEMAELNEIPFHKYYGTVDATPLFIMLAGHYFRRTYDKETISAIWPSIELALNWIEEFGDIDGDGFVEYKQRMETGLSNQGWKDSYDCVFHADGELARAPIALCEVQGYVYDAYIQASYLAREFNKASQSKSWKEKAQGLKKKFNEVFWDDDLDTLVIALDGEKKPCRIKTSNAGQCLFTGIVDKQKAKKLVKTLMLPDLFCGWGIRTLSANSVRYNPMSYHNGSVWPHDTALVAAGMARYGFIHPAMQLLDGLFSASLYVDLQRLPELFCGFASRNGEAPTSYPVACMPQAWAVASVYLMLQSCLQVAIDAQKKVLSLNNPTLPSYLEKVCVRNLVVESGIFELEFQRYEWDVSIHIISKPSDWKVIVHR